MRRGLCLACEKAYDRRRGSAAERGYGPEWAVIRDQVMLEEPFCRTGDGRPTEEIDHIIPRALGGTDDRFNLQGLCRHHHSAKTMRERVAGG